MGEEEEGSGIFASVAPHEETVHITEDLLKRVNESLEYQCRLQALHEIEVGFPYGCVG